MCTVPLHASAMHPNHLFSLWVLILLLKGFNLIKHITAMAIISLYIQIIARIKLTIMVLVLNHVQIGF